MDGGRLLAGADYPGVFHSTDQGATWTVFTTLDGQPAGAGWTPRNAGMRTDWP